jgi:cystathionine beta-lyase
VLAFTQPGDEIIVQPPVYFPFFQAIKDNGRQLVYNPLKRQGNRYMMDMDDLEQKTTSRTRMIIISNPHNPGGMAWQPKELKALLEHCKKHHLLLISDEIHCDLVLPQHKHTVAATVTDYAPDITITMMAPSKTFNMAGLASSSVIISNPQLRDKYNAINETLHLYMGNVFGNVASQAAYLHGTSWLQALLKHIQDNIEYVKEFIAHELPNIGMIEPEATYMVWLDFSKTGLRGKALNDHLINKALLGLNPGTQFGPGGETFMRMNLACPMSTVQEAMKRLKASF